MFESVRYLLLQIRNDDDPMRKQEVQCFARALQAEESQFATYDLLSDAPAATHYDRFDVVLLGGSGHYSAAGEAEWLDRALDGLRLLHEIGKPTFASCWGFQAFARALGGVVVHDFARAEIGTKYIRRTEAGRADPLFAELENTFQGQMGHEDRVSVLPSGATLLASTDLVENQAYRFDDKPIYCTQFHPELNRADLLRRIRAYPSYIERVAGLTLAEFEAQCHDTPQTEALLPRFVKMVLS
jgi:GMP synthase (glutamine-hydrolysing)